MNDWVNEWIDAPTNPGKIILNVIYPLLGVTAPACSKGKGPTLFYLAAGIKLKRAKGIHETKKKTKKTCSGENLLANYGTTISKPFKCSKKIKYNLLPWFDYSSVATLEIPFHYYWSWLARRRRSRWPVPSNTVRARGGGSTNEIYCETKRPHNAQITNRSYSIWQAHNVQCIKHKHAWPRSELQKRPT